MNKPLAPGLRILAAAAHLLAASLTLTAPLALAQPAVPASTAAAAASTDPCSSTPQAAFDVATVKPSTQSAGDSSISGRRDILSASGTISRAIQYAYDLHEFQITGGPGWLTTATWEIVAKVDQPPADWQTLSSDIRNTVQRERLQAVLAQRFALKCHFETKELPVYNLVVAKSGSKLTPTPADAANKGSINTHGEKHHNLMEVSGVAIDELVANLSRSLGRTVIDKTGLTGLFDFTLTYTSDTDAASPAPASDPDAASGPSLFTALEEQLGLKLESAKGPVPILVIDSIDRPSEN